ncbi:hypothetical protein BS50DRAFT_625507 [Corynespora cassiicola Philippines]|uniref:DUF4188 domain-containing protein n=1 Tax=Corynespora cassiicola Philippines TaxID=1448308 RepID=A0A2T2N720_CORCC|nr:hypothetical protein BS50DRAFT_625507 [Corynespora cassiicola Philippines]
MALPKLIQLRDDLQMSTWILVGACLQASLLIFLPPRVAIAPSFLLLLTRLFIFLFTRQGLLPDSSLKDSRLGKYTAQIPQHDGSFSKEPSDQDVVVFILGAQSNHVQGRFAPNFLALGDAFGDMWRDLAKNREKNGYLGKTSTLYGTDRDSGNTAVWISYWTSVEKLHEWALGPLHKRGMAMFYNKKKSTPHIGLMHELYVVPKKNWENVYYNFTPFGMGQTHPTHKEKSGSFRSVSPLIKADGPTWKSSGSRMGW